jgi:hypothetical protein
MTEPDWYVEWRHTAIHELQAKNEALAAKFWINDWPRWDYDIDAGTLVFSDDTGPRVQAAIQVAGSTSANAGNWLWAWANSQCPDAIVQGSLLAKRFGEEHGIDELVRDVVGDERDDLNGLGWSLTAVAAKVSDAVGAYRPPRSEGGGLYLMYTRVDWVA